MKLLSNQPVSSRAAVARGLTIVEMMISVTVFALLILATISLQIYASRVYTLAATKLSATTTARTALNEIRDEIRSGQTVYVGNYFLSTGNPVLDFTPIADGSLQEGNAVMIYPATSNTNTFTLLFLQPGNGTTNFVTSNSSGQVINTNYLILETYTNGSIEASNSVASYITNSVVFMAQDYENNILTNNVNNRIIQVQMFFSQWEYPIAYIGSNEFNAYNYYRVQTRITRRLTE
jgi:Tfp pilus assembly protein PilW